MERELPELHAHLAHLHVELTSFLPSWLGTLFMTDLNPAPTLTLNPTLTLFLTPTSSLTMTRTLTLTRTQPLPEACPYPGTLFMTTLALDTAARCWDCYLRDGELFVCTST